MILARGELAFVIVNSFPYNPGHLMVAPFRHVGAFTSLEAAELADVDALVARSIRALEQEMEPHGYNLGMNLGRVAGAGIPDHVHWHLVPRWNGDTNFMPVVGQTRRAAGAARGNVRAAPAAEAGEVKRIRGSRRDAARRHQESNASTPGARSLAFMR